MISKFVQRPKSFDVVVLRLHPKSLFFCFLVGDLLYLFDTYLLLWGCDLERQNNNPN